MEAGHHVFLSRVDGALLLRSFFTAPPYKMTVMQYGGLYCNGGTAEKPFPNRPYCVDGTGTVKAVNRAGSIVSFCQTVLPGNEAMIIPTDVDDVATLAVPGPDYWAGTAAQ
jgi:hypothetical protein